MARITIGTLALPPNMYLSLAPWLKIWSMQTPKKSTNISSATGRSPVAAAPTAAPMYPDSEIGVSSTRSRPKRWTRPLVTPSTPPQASSCSNPGTVAPPATSSPMSTTSGSRSISTASASLTASRKVSVRVATDMATPPLPVGDVDVGERVLGLGLGAALGERDRLVDRGLGGRVALLDLLGGQQAALLRLLGEEGERVVLAVGGRLLGGPVGDLVALEVAEVAPGLRLDQAGAVAPAGPGHRLLRHLVHGDHVVAVDRDAGDVVGGGAVGDVARRAVVADRGGLGEAVVLRPEDHRALPDRRQVHALVGGALLGRAVAEEAGAHRAGALALGGEPRPAGQRRAAADDAVGAEHAAGDVGDVHRAALALAGAVDAAEQLGHHRAQLHARAAAAGGAAVPSGDEVLVPEVGADTHRDRLLTGVQVHEPGDLAVGEQLRHAFLEGSDGHHAVVEPEGLVLGELHGVLPSVDLDNPGTTQKPTLASRPSHEFVPGR